MIQRMTMDLFKEALTMSVWRRKPKPGLIHHTDRSSRFADKVYQRDLKKYGMICSLSRKSDCWDDAVVEPLFLSLKTERKNHCLYRNREEAKRDVVDCLKCSLTASGYIRTWAI